MKNTVVAILLVVAALATFATGTAAAQTPQPATPANGTGAGFGGWRGGLGPPAGIGQEGPLHEYMVKAMSQALGISADEFESRRAAGETASQIALASGVVADKVPSLISTARANALDAAVVDKVITREQADLMISRGGAGMGLGCSGGARQGSGMGRGSRFQQPTP